VPLTAAGGCGTHAEPGRARKCLTFMLGLALIAACSSTAGVSHLPTPPSPQSFGPPGVVHSLVVASQKPTNYISGALGDLAGSATGVGVWYWTGGQDSHGSRLWFTGADGPTFHWDPETAMTPSPDCSAPSDPTTPIAVDLADHAWTLGGCGKAPRNRLVEIDAHQGPIGSWNVPVPSEVKAPSCDGGSSCPAFLPEVVDGIAVSPDGRVSIAFNRGSGVEILDSSHRHFSRLVLPHGTFALGSEFAADGTLAVRLGSFDRFPQTVVLQRPSGSVKRVEVLDASGLARAGTGFLVGTTKPVLMDTTGTQRLLPAPQEQVLIDIGAERTNYSIGKLSMSTDGKAVLLYIDGTGQGLFVVDPAGHLAVLRVPHLSPATNLRTHYSIDAAGDIWVSAPNYSSSLLEAPAATY
jgi:hypothetical protein